MWIYGYAHALSSTETPPREERLGYQSGPHIRFAKSNLAFRVKRGRAEEWDDDHLFEDRTIRVYAREVASPEHEAEIAAVEAAVAEAERALHAAQDRRQQTLLAIAQRCKPARAPEKDGG